MSTQWAFDEVQPFLDKVRELLASGVDKKDISLITPFHVHEAEHLLKAPPSKLKFFTLAGAFSGLFAGFALTIFTVLDWPLITGGKPLISIPAFLVIAFELTILIGAVASFIGFIVLGRFPSLKGILRPTEHDNQFIVIVKGGEA